MIEPLVKFVNLFKYLAITLRIRNYPFDIFVCQYRDADFITVNVKQCIFISLVQKRTGFGLLRCQRIKYCLKIRCYQKPNMQLWKIIIFMDKYFTLVLSITFSSFFFYPFLNTMQLLITNIEECMYIFLCVSEVYTFQWFIMN